MHDVEELRDLQTRLAEFASKRDWERFHTPKNLVMALAGEVGELSELFQWLTPEEASALAADPHQAARVEEEMADVFLYLLRLADVIGVDLVSAALKKMQTNAEHYPEHLARGKAVKYTELREK
jgi:NTP pyrophosphatase (non-canonical NTP hydrolase)